MALAIAAPGASAKPAAVEEYTLTLPGVERLGSEKPAPIELRGRDAGPVGVVGETEPPRSPLDSIVSPAGLFLLLAFGGSVWLAASGPGLRR